MAFGIVRIGKMSNARTPSYILKMIASRCGTRIVLRGHNSEASHSVGPTIGPGTLLIAKNPQPRYSLGLDPNFLLRLAEFLAISRGDFQRGATSRKKTRAPTRSTRRGVRRMYNEKVIISFVNLRDQRYNFNPLAMRKRRCARKFGA